MPYQFGTKVAPPTRKNSRETPKSSSGFPTVSSLGGLPRPRELPFGPTEKNYIIVNTTASSNISRYVFSSFSDDFTKMISMSDEDYPTFWVRTFDENTLDFTTVDSSCFRFDGNRYGKVYYPQNSNCLRIANDGNVFLATGENISVGIIESSVYAFSSTGTLRWSLKINHQGSTNNRVSSIYDMHFDSEGNIVIGGAYATSASLSAGFIAKINRNDGSLIWARELRLYTASAQETLSIYSISLDKNDNDSIYFTGQGGLFPDSICYGKLDSNGNSIFTNRIRILEPGATYGYLYNYAKGIYVDSSGSVYVQQNYSTETPGNGRILFFKQNRERTSNTVVWIGGPDSSKSISTVSQSNIIKVTSNGDIITAFNYSGDSIVSRSSNGLLRFSINNVTKVWEYRLYSIGDDDADGIGTSLGGLNPYLINDKFYSTGILRNDDAVSNNYHHLVLVKTPEDVGNRSIILGPKNDVYFESMVGVFANTTGNNTTIGTQNVEVSNASNIIWGTGVSTTANGTTVYFSVANTYPAAYGQTEYVY
jgi:hypothetical protein